MYRRLLTIMLGILWMAFASAPAFCQTKSLKFGLRGGLNLAKTTEENANLIVPVEGIDLTVTSDIKNRNVLGVGGFVEFWLSSAFAIQANGLYNQKGEKLDIKLSGSYFEPQIGATVNVVADAKASLELAYFSFPVMGKFSFGKAPGFRPYLMAGPEIAFLSSAKTSDIEGKATVSVPSQGISETVPIDESGDDIKDQMESVEFALNFGGGFAFPLGGGVDGFLDGRYGLGLSKILKEGEDIKNNVIYLNLGLIFK